MKYYYLLLLVQLLISCSGSSSNSSQTSNSYNDLFANFSDTILSNNCSGTCNATNFKTAEYYTERNYIDSGNTYTTQDFLGLIKAADAYAYLSNQGKNWAGDQVNLAVVDTGIVMNHSDLDGNYSPNSNANSLLDEFGHGTHVAGIAAAEKNDSGMHGVAPNANLLSVAYKDLGLDYGIVNYDEVVKDLDADIVNMSWGSTLPYNAETNSSINLYKNEISNLVTDNQDLVIVIAAGNEGDSNPVYPAYLAQDSVANGQMLAVAAYDSVTDNIAGFSNRCGNVQYYCLMAPGVDIYSTYNDGDYVISSGTSMAAPVVSGAAAVLKSAWPSLTGAEIVQILLTTADVINGYSGTNTTTGHGLLNLYAAVQQQGTSTTAISNLAYSYDESQLFIPTEYRDFFTTTEFENFIKQGVLFDAYGRDYKANYLSKITFLDSEISNNNFQKALLKNTYNFQQTNFNYAGLNFNVNSRSNLLTNYFFINPDNKETDIEFSDFNYSFKTDKLSFNLASDSTKVINFLQEQFFDKFNILTTTNLTNYFNSASGFKGFDIQAIFQENDKYLMSIAVMAKENEVSKSEFSGFTASFNKFAQKMNLSLKYQFIQETNSSQAIGGLEAFKVAENYKTNILELSSSYKVNKINYFVQYGLMETINQNKQNSFINMSEKFYTDNFALGVVKEFNQKFHMGFIFSKPWQINKGDFTYTIPVGLDNNGTIITDSYKVDFSKQVKLDYEIFLQKQFSDNNALKFNFILHESKFSGQKTREAEILMFYDYFF